MLKSMEDLSKARHSAKRHLQALAHQHGLVCVHQKSEVEHRHTHPVAHMP